MQIRISDMMDQASDLCENKNAANPGVDLNIIKNKVLPSINESKPAPRKIIKRKKAILLVAAAMILATGTIVIAKTHLAAGGLIDKNNKEEVMTDTFAMSTDSISGTQNTESVYNGKSSSDIPSWAKDENIAQEFAFIDGKADSNVISLPECYLENGCMLVMENGKSGFKLKKGQKIVFDIDQSFAGTDTGASLKIRTGYILDDTYTVIGDAVDGDDEPLEFTVPKSGTYDFTFLNLSSDRVIITANLTKK